MEMVGKQKMNDLIGGKDFKYYASFRVRLKKISTEPKTAAIEIKKELEWFERMYLFYGSLYGFDCLPCKVYSPIIDSLKQRQYSLAKVL